MGLLEDSNSDFCLLIYCPCLLSSSSSFCLFVPLISLLWALLRIPTLTSVFLFIVFFFCHNSSSSLLPFFPSHFLMFIFLLPFCPFTDIFMGLLRIPTLLPLHFSLLLLSPFNLLHNVASFCLFAFSLAHSHNVFLLPFVRASSFILFFFTFDSNSSSSSLFLVLLLPLLILSFLLPPFQSFHSYYGLLRIPTPTSFCLLFISLFPTVIILLPSAFFHQPSAFCFLFPLPFFILSLIPTLTSSTPFLFFFFFFISSSFFFFISFDFCFRPPTSSSNSHFSLSFIYLLLAHCHLLLLLLPFVLLLTFYGPTFSNSSICLPFISFFLLLYPSFSSFSLHLILPYNPTEDSFSHFLLLLLTFFLFFFFLFSLFFSSPLSFLFLLPSPFLSSTSSSFLLLFFFFFPSL
ncbi:unnamed protein product [Acanthosepion pharaonis]|uniref:Uncharacterized protein n=1 Tax=Acanthosepion pharaonis TaxID=158019 RepID=A0A812BZB9_ACAPH|nr:unnamed protein product [Sepia pharaonis]